MINRGKKLQFSLSCPENKIKQWSTTPKGTHMYTHNITIKTHSIASQNVHIYKYDAIRVFFIFLTKIFLFAEDVIDCGSFDQYTGPLHRKLSLAILYLKL